MAIHAEPSFSLKDHLFNTKKVELIAAQIAAVYPSFQAARFVQVVTAQFPQLELMQRLHWVRDCLREYLPDEYQMAVRILVESLPPPSDPTLCDDDFGDFIYGPYGAFVAEYGCTAHDLEFSLCALKEMTTRFSVEFPIRSFINVFPDQTLAFLLQCATDKHYHVRRLASEGTRQRLPWAKKITINYTDPLPILNTLYVDTTRYVTRSVANHLNDISKIDPDLVVSTLSRWHQSGLQVQTEMDFIIRHSLRTLEKQGHTGALQLLGYAAGEVEVRDFIITTKQVRVGEVLEFSFSVMSTAHTPQRLLIDYHLYFQKATGQLVAKTFKIAKTTIAPGELLTFTKKQPFRRMTTRVLHPGAHAVAIQINGTTYSRLTFNLLNP